MTLDALITKLQALQKKGHGRYTVVVDKESLWDGNGTFVCCNVNSLEAELINVADGDGFSAMNKDGSERMMRAIILSGKMKG